jgi:hypothetical protein
MSVHVHVDRHDELRLFEDLLEGRRDERILLVEGPPGLGKTLLMLEYGRMAREAGVPCARVDLKLPGTAAFDVLGTMCEEWVECPFRQFRWQVEALQRPGAEVTVRGVVQFGRSTIRVAMSDPDETARRERRWLVTGAVMADVREWLEGEGRAVMLLDSYDPDKVTPDVQQWVEGTLLPHVRRTPGLVVVVAGQRTPPASAMWEEVCCRLELGPLDDPDDWMVFVEAEEIQATREVVSAMCHVFEGHPMMLATKLSTLRTWGGAA